MAHKEHQCCDCEFPIFAGDEYWAKVMVYGRRFWIEKRHIFCPMTPEEEREEFERNFPKPKQVAAAAA